MIWRRKRQRRRDAIAILSTGLKVLYATGWDKTYLGAYRIARVDEDGAHCAVGAAASGANILGLLDMVDGMPYHPARKSAYNTALTALASAVPRGAPMMRLNFDGSSIRRGSPGDVVYRYNDAVATTQHDIIVLFDRAIESLEGA